MKQIVAVLILLFLTGCATSGTRKIASESLASVAAISDELAIYVETLGRPVYAYHYSVGAPRESSAAIWKNLNQASSAYLNLDAGEPYGILPGLYLALDPLASREFGGTSTNWLLYRLELPKGLRYLNISGIEDEPLSEDIKKVLAKDGCVLSGEYLKYPRSFSYGTLLKQNLGPVCRRIGQEVYRSLGVQALAYSYVVMSSSDCSDSNSLAFILFDTTGVTPEAVREFSGLIPVQSQYKGEQLFTEELFLEDQGSGHGYFAENLPHGGRLWPDLDSATIDRQAYKSWKRGHLMNCQRMGDQ